MMETVLVIGAARSGIAAARLLKKHGYNVILTDLKAVPQKEQLETEGIQVLDEGHPEFLKRTDYPFVIKNPGIPYHADLVRFFVESGVPVYTEIELASRLASGLHYGAITGTDGKTTITTLLEKMLQKKDPLARSAGNIGTPLSELVFQEEQDKDIALELSNFQLLGTEDFRPDAAVISNLAPDHLDYMKDLDGYYDSKFRIVKNMREEDLFILNLDDPEIVSRFEKLGTPRFQVATLSLNQPADIRVQNGNVYFRDIFLFSLEDLNLVGKFNLMNAMMAAVLALHMGVSPEKIRQTIQEFHGLEHRIEPLGEIAGVKIYNDSKSTNTHSTQAALSAFEKPVYLLCGGFNKGIDYAPLKELDGQVKECFAFGAIAGQFKEVFSRTTELETMEQALDAALQKAEKGDVILLSPATSSFDQFRNYEERGKVFKELVERRKTR